VPPSQDLFSLYFKYYEDTEPPVIFHRWSLITCLSAYLGRQYWLPFGSQRIFPNFYTMLIGHPGARKSTAIKLGKKLFSTAGYATFAAEKTSKEKFLLDLEGLTDEELSSTLGRRNSGRRSMKGLTHDELTDMLFGKEKSDEPKEPKEVFIVADEFNEFVGSGNLEFLSLLGMLWDWDDEQADYQFRLKNSKSVSIYQPTITILSGNTHAGFVEAFPPQAIGQGFLSRLILVYGEPSGKKISFPRPPSEELRAGIIDLLHKIKGNVVGPATITEDAERALDMIYRSWRDLEDGRFKHYSTRRFSHLLKLCLVVSAAHGAPVIGIEEVVLANTIMVFTENDMPKALGEFGKSKDADVSGKIMTALYEANKPLTTSELLRIVKNDLDKVSQLGEIMMKLQNSGQVQNVPGVGFLPKTKILDTKQLYVKFELLKEWQMKFGTGAIRRVQ
jgi:hypothetical protein